MAGSTLEGPYDAEPVGDLRVSGIAVEDVATVGGLDLLESVQKQWQLSPQLLQTGSPRARRTCGHLARRGRSHEYWRRVVIVLADDYIGQRRPDTAGCPKLVGPKFLQTVILAVAGRALRTLSSGLSVLGWL